MASKSHAGGGHNLTGHVGFQRMKNSLAHQKGITDPGAVAASIGRKKYGAHKFAEMSAAGRHSGK